MIVIPTQKIFAKHSEYEVLYIASLKNSSVVFFFKIGITISLVQDVSKPGFCHKPGL
jgi:hypothetical protein